jgi:hypothetical protein
VSALASPYGATYHVVAAGETLPAVIPTLLGHRWTRGSAAGHRRHLLCHQCRVEPHSAVALWDPASVLEVAFVRRRGGRDRVYVTRSDGTSTGWDFPSYGDWLPHDLCHLVVEEELKLKDGFWGLVDRGVEVGLINNQARLIRDGTPLVEHPDVDLTGLMEAEAAVAAWSGPAATETADLPVATPAEAVATIRCRLDTLGEQWRALDDGGAITLQVLSWRRPDSHVTGTRIDPPRMSAGDDLARERVACR